MGLKLSSVPFEISYPAQSFGVEIENLKLHKNLSFDTIAAIKKCLAYRGFVLFRNQNLTRREQVAVTRLLGNPNLKLHSWAPQIETTTFGDDEVIPNGLPLINHGEILYFVNGPDFCDKTQDEHAIWDEKDNHTKGKGTSCWHTGDSEAINVETINCLYAELAAAQGGATLFCDTVAAYNDLEDSLKKRIDNLRVVHYFVDPQRTEPVNQPLVKTNPITRQKYLYLNYNTMERVEGLSRSESYRLLKFLFDHQIKDQYVYEHFWKQDDFLIWNCNGTMHKRGALVSNHNRIMRRTQAIIPEFTSYYERDKSLAVTSHDNEDWHPYPFERAELESAGSA
ncbi:TauD/TfdA dioxygenase family protein [Pseudomonas syringae]|uniref:TauD/TfdA dioxygenase family protein n=1 Tax=Pseudomonas syringae TaxID=317 RepID=UPI000D7717F0|nr:TauD/TfdA family dioxygenase [Pseudomonas syringae]MDF5775089.1 TauD/TfdA family dioxygenase [Pseudomonas syringae pv. syringae]RXT68115.1 taurine catabolism dioxygenase TauD [Pseudomonas syringae]